MTEYAVLLSLTDRMLWTTALIAGPILFASLTVGLVVGIIQAATSVNEQTLTFVPKLAVTAIVLVFLGSSIVMLLSDFLNEIFNQISQITQ